MTSFKTSPHYLKVRVTERIREFLRACLAESEIRGQLEERTVGEVEQLLESQLEERTVGEVEQLLESQLSGGEERSEEFREELKFVSLKEVFSVYRECQELESSYFSREGRVYIHQLLRGSEVYFTPPEKPQRNPKLVARLAKIQKKLDNQAYSQMVSNLGERRIEHGSLAIDMKSLNVQMVHAFNVLLSFICAFAFGFATGYYSGLEHAVSAVIGVSLCVPVLLADMYFLLKYYDAGDMGLVDRNVADRKNE